MRQSRKLLILLAALIVAMGLAPTAFAHPDDGAVSDGGDHEGELHGPAENVVRDSLAEHDAATEGIVSSGPTTKKQKNLDVIGRGIRNETGVTTDVWVHDGYAYTGTFSTLCSTGDNDSGIWVWDVHNPNKPELVSIIDSPAGSKANDVRVATMNSGDVLVLSNESCNAGPGGFDIYDVDDPANPVFITRVQTDDVNTFLVDAFGFTDFGVHNLWLFTQGDRDYVAATVESEFGNFQIYDITEPANPERVGWWGAEELRLAELNLDIDPADITDFGLILELDDYLFDGFGASSNRFLHDVTITADGQFAYLANWDAGLVLLDISDPTNPTLVSVALDPVNGSLDGEVNSHAVWPSENGRIVVEGEEDFSVFESDSPFAGTFGENATNTIPGVGISTNAGTAFEASQTGNTVTVTSDAVTVTNGPLAGTVYPALEFVGDQPRLDGGSVEGQAVWAGRACDEDGLLNEGELQGAVAIVRRGECFFSEKLANVAAAGATAIVISNNQEDSVWSGLRIWDYSDPENPVLASTFNTVCSANPSDPSCDPAGTYSAHNVIVETRGNKVLAYIAWYSDGVIVLDVTNPYAPVEIARYLGETEAGDPNDFWGIHKEDNSPFIYASDRNGGLYVLKLKGQGRN